MPELSWEQAVEWLRQQPDQQALVRDCYFDDPLLDAARRFEAGAEWQATLPFLPSKPGSALDLGAGRGISSYALACAGWQVTALEPDPSLLVGAGAIRSLAQDASLPITVVQDYGEKLPFEANMFDLVYGRQVLHHARDLKQLCREINRVLKPKGRFVAVREHVVSTPGDLQLFLDKHPLHKLYEGENAYLLEEYKAAITGSGLRLKKTLGPFENVINYFPMTDQQWRRICVQPLAHRLGQRRAAWLASERYSFGRFFLRLLASWRSWRDNAPGRVYSFIADKS